MGRGARRGSLTRACGGRVVGAAVVASAKLALGAWVLALGFSHVSDDDFARVVIAQGFAHAPRLDPSGTSWLPFPFWITGAAMMAFGRSLATARALTMGLSALGVAAVYLAVRAAGRGRGAALAVAGAGLLVPLDAWLGVATVPEAYTGALVAAALLAAPVRAARPLAGGALLVAALSRYEAWPACATFAVYAAACAWREPEGAAQARARRTDGLAALLAATGPLAWMAWNAHAHGSATHFLARVARYRVAVGAAPSSLGERLLGYPRALLETAPWIAALGAIGLALLVLLRAPQRRELGLPIAGAIATLAFLVYGDVKDGAPTHHPERALGAVIWICAAVGVAGVHALHEIWAARRSAREVWVVAAAAGAAVLAIGWATRAVRDLPGRDAASRRDEQIARGRALSASGAARIEVTPCAYEHFALLAAYEAPERARIVPAASAARLELPSAACPAVRMVE